jgi:hypothetical protein
MSVSVLLFIAAAGMLHGLGSRDTRTYRGEDAFDAPDGARVAITGTVRLVGADPFPELVVTTEDGTDWFVRLESREALTGRERETVAVEATLSYRELLRADGVLLGRRRELDEVELLSVNESADP